LRKALSNAFISAVGNTAKQTKRSICPEFISILVQEFTLQVEANTNALHRSDTFALWCSDHNLDQHFGALGTLHTVDFCGRSTFAFPNPDAPTEIAMTLDIATRLLDSRWPSRMLILLPHTIQHKFMIIAHLQNTPIFEDCKSGPPLTLALAINKESMFVDPINWSSIRARLREWSPLIQTHELTDALFRERECLLLSHSIAPLWIRSS